ncbi:LuxR C-terminal-related transcriptional regulator [Ruegeria pomeroyi]|uniref:Transcriptional regulator, LuxR family n=2 Tax=Ruegeria pomeroyi TaxID=89184 RepID=Q5LQF4_RUEPO|nr:helix-turn-helix transcriptional regulator [Ruegeria pomeroyi]HCE70303.1 LuxR family transcriptional regulator [Ruegeria sp.]AAV95786.1 transcriptional regulator, LuxR family [Ruegeria pomeroyi DSS-3]NVK98892.1 LuxR family transcriptional regulator [Ruegeria pomeroyi]NVL03126.1 LuxR family transcriptional regulator [Ruegeria pomeroyi]QWV09363.1 LuxR C-terminal-related transcriptional regulator [Ruegeria pomeroyi]
MCTARSIDDFASVVVPFCRDVFAVQSVLAIRFHPSGPPEPLFKWVLENHLEALFDRDYTRFGYLLDPFYKLAVETENWVACPLREIAPDRFETSEYFSNYFGPMGLVDDMGFVARVDDDTSVNMSIGRHAGKRRFRASEIARFRSLSTVLVPSLLSVLGKPTKRNPGVPATLEHRFLTISQNGENEISDREAEVATLIVQGHSSRAIGYKLGISSNTVKVHRRNLYKKLNISSQSELFGLLTQNA